MARGLSWALQPGASPGPASPARAALLALRPRAGASKPRAGGGPPPPNLSLPVPSLIRHYHFGRGGGESRLPGGAVARVLSRSADKQPLCPPASSVRCSARQGQLGGGSLRPRRRRSPSLRQGRTPPAAPPAGHGLEAASRSGSGPLKEHDSLVRQLAGGGGRRPPGKELLESGAFPGRRLLWAPMCGWALPSPAALHCSFRQCAARRHPAPGSPSHIPGPADAGAGSTVTSCCMHSPAKHPWGRLWGRQWQ